MSENTDAVETIKESRPSELEAELVARLQRVEARNADLAKELKVMRGENETLASRVDKLYATGLMPESV